MHQHSKTKSLVKGIMPGDCQFNDEAFQIANTRKKSLHKIDLEIEDKNPVPAIEAKGWSHSINRPYTMQEKFYRSGFATERSKPYSELSPTISTQYKAIENCPGTRTAERSCLQTMSMNNCDELTQRYHEKTEINFLSPFLNSRSKNHFDNAELGMLKSNKMRWYEFRPRLIINKYYRRNYMLGSNKNANHMIYINDPKDLSQEATANIEVIKALDKARLRTTSNTAKACILTGKYKRLSILKNYRPNLLRQK